MGSFYFFLSILLRPLLLLLFSKGPFVAEVTGFCLITLPVVFYFSLMEASSRGGTLGKRKWNIRVVKKDGEPIGVGRAIFRSVIKFIPWEMSHFAIWNILRPSSLPDSLITFILFTANILAILYIFFPLVNKQRKNIYDWIAGTSVIHNQNEEVPL
ncbi:RDD family protein [Bacillus sp. FJAT-49736]|uniref:RDD family protein n=1 Tax=Bacillus sp. FJAT-49736 TaxID=2833582 RepID=UPI001BC9E19B|nr:RDD family protein [Bacillus sp. FJAT-49736]MBS4175355.1 RDD family protein [Bacillus sp. FJAT-49736]